MPTLLPQEVKVSVARRIYNNHRNPCAPPDSPITEATESTMRSSDISGYSRKKKAFGTTAQTKALCVDVDALPSTVLI